MRFLTACLLLLSLSLATYAQETSVSGKVTDTKGQPVSGATVTEVSGTAKATTAQDGSFSIRVTDTYGYLLIQHPDFRSKEVFIGGNSTLDISIQSGASAPINVGFGSTTREELTSSVSQVNASKLANQAVIDVEQASQGRAAGVFIQNNGGKLGEGTTVRIRGGSSLTASNEPLYVVDGVPLASSNQSNINPSDIASMEILKDASAAAIYGSRAANGVVLITTKSGSAGKMKVDVDYQFGISQTPKRLDLYTPTDYRSQIFDFGLRVLEEQLAFVPGPEGAAARAEVDAIIAETTAENLAEWMTNRQIVLSDGTTYDFAENEFGTANILRPLVATLDSNTYVTDWQDEVFRTAASHRANLSLSGGTDKLGYFTGLSYTGQEGILIGNQYDRLNGRLNLKGKFSERVSANASLSYAHVSNKALNEDADLGSPLQAIVLPPSDGYDPNNDYKLFVRSNEYNPLTEIYNSDNLEIANQFIGNLGLTVKLADQLDLNIEGGADYEDFAKKRRQGPETLDGNPTGLSSIRSVQTLNYLGTAYLTYSQQMGTNKFSAVLGGSYQRSITDVTFRQLRVNSLDEVAEAPDTRPDLLAEPIPSTGYVFLSSFARVNYSISSKYVFQVSGRMDGSSRFGANNRYGFFPAASAGWNLSEEGFLSGVGAISLLKLKASYGLVGNTPDEDFLYRRNYFNVRYGNDQGIRLSNLENPDLRWETTAQIDLGLDFGFFEDRLSGSINYYQKNTSDLIFPKPVSLTSGYANVLQNVGSMENKGFEFALSTVNVEKSNFYWSTDFNIATNQNIVTDLGGDTLILGVNAYLEGHAAGSFYMPKYAGVDPQTGYALYETNSEGVTTDDYERALTARQVVGNPNPKFFGGLGNTLGFGPFELNFLFQFVYGKDVYFATGEYLSNSGILNLSQSRDQLDRWYRPGDQASNPVIDPFQVQTYPSSRWIQDGSYIRLNNLSLSYNFPAEMVQGWGLRNASAYVGGQNLLTFTKYTGYDPDVSYIDPEGGTINQNISRGNDYFTTPQARVFTIGIKVGL